MPQNNLCVVIVIILPEPEGYVPSDWSAVLTTDGRTYFVNSVTKATTWEDPEEDSSSDSDSDASSSDESETESSEADPKPVVAGSYSTVTKFDFMSINEFKLRC